MATPSGRPLTPRLDDDEDCLHESDNGKDYMQEAFEIFDLSRFQGKGCKDTQVQTQVRDCEVGLGRVVGRGVQGGQRSKGTR